MTSNKYIIKNCPNITFIDIWRLDPKWSYCKLKKCGCENNTDCLLKRIVSECLKTFDIYDNKEFYEDDYDKVLGKSIMAETIMKLLKTRECK